MRIIIFFLYRLWYQISLKLTDLLRDEQFIASAGGYLEVPITCSTFHHRAVVKISSFIIAVLQEVRARYGTEVSGYVRMLSIVYTLFRDCRRDD